MRVEPLGPQPGAWEAAHGVAVFELFGTESPNSDFDGVAEVCRHAAAALGNAATFEAQGFGGRIRRLAALAESRRTRTIAGAVLVLLALLIVIPTDFDLEAHGQVQPVRRRQLYAPADGLITRVEVSNAKLVDANEEIELSAGGLEGVDPAMLHT